MRWWIISLASYYLAKKRKTILGGFSDPMHLFIKYSIFYNFLPRFGPRFWDIFSIQEMRWWISSLASYYLAKKRKTVLLGFADPLHLFIKNSIFYNFWPKFGARFWDISLVQAMRWWIISLASYYLAKKRKTILGGFSDPMHLFIKYSIFYNFLPRFGPRFWDIFSIQEMRWWISSLASYYLAKKRQTVLWGFADPMHLFIKYSIFYTFLPRFGPRFWDIFSIQEMRWWISSLASYYPAKKRKTVLGEFSDPMHLFIK